MTVKEANDFIAKWRPRLCSEWTIEVREGHSPALPAGEHNACIDPSEDYLRAVLHLGNAVGDELTPFDQRRCLLHELLHLTVNDLERVAREPVNALGHDMHRLGKELVTWQVERLVDRLAVVLAEESA